MPHSLPSKHTAHQEMKFLFAHNGSLLCPVVVQAR